MVRGPSPLETEMMPTQRPWTRGAGWCGVVGGLTALSGFLASCGAWPRKPEGARAWIAPAEARSEWLELAPGDAAQLARVRADCRPSPGLAATSPPWPAVMVIEDRAGRRDIFQLVALVLRTDPDHPFAPNLATTLEPSGAGRVHDCSLDEDAQDWVWALLREKLGPTSQKEYQMLPSDGPLPFPMGGE
jgi:hypothetical protein